MIWSKPAVQSLPDQVGRAILERIASGALKPGQHLPSQRNLARSLGVGLAVVREAIQRLEALNVLETSHGRGCVVLPFRWTHLLFDPAVVPMAVHHLGVRDVWETRRLIEAQIIRLAAQRCSEDNLAELREILSRAEPLPATYAQTQALNCEFHLAVAAAAQNAVLRDILEPLLNLQVEAAKHDFSAKRCREAWQAHWRMYEAIAAHDLDLADSAIEHHFQVGPMALAFNRGEAGKLHPPYSEEKIIGA